MWPNHQSYPIWHTRFFNWRIWIEGDKESLDRIHKVKYILHPSFERGYGESTDRGMQFMMDARLGQFLCEN